MAKGKEIIKAFEEIASTSESASSSALATETQGKEIVKAFEEVVSASASSSALTKKAAYDVFINHCGDNVKHTLASALYGALHRLGLRVFMDKEELELGDFIPDQTQDAMQSSLLHIAIFPPNYARSPWCLPELSFMLKTGNKLIPVFYNVEPSVLRWATGIYAHALSEHKAKGRYNSEKLEDWKAALHNVSYNYGYELLKNNESQVETTDFLKATEGKAK